MLNRLKLSGARSLLALLGLVGWLLCSASAVQSAPPPAAGTVVQTPQVRAQLLVFAPDGVSVGKTLWLGLQMQHQKLWHTYYKKNWRGPYFLARRDENISWNLLESSQKRSERKG